MAAASGRGPALRLNIANLRWRGRLLGRLAATFVTQGSGVEAPDLRLSGAGDEARGALDCTAARCHATFTLESQDAAATLERLGFRADVDARHADASGELTWPATAAPSLADASGRIRIDLSDGVTRGAAAEDSQSPPLGLLAVPGLADALALPELPFARLSADFAVSGGEAVTRNLQLDGDTEILLQGRIGLVARDYDAWVWVLKGEERLPAAVRALRPAPGVAAVWMSLRDLFGGADHERGALRLRGTWVDPMVTQP